MFIACYYLDNGEGHFKAKEVDEKSDNVVMTVGEHSFKPSANTRPNTWASLLL